MMQCETLPLEFDAPLRDAGSVRLGPGTVLLTAFARDQAGQLQAAIEDVRLSAPLRHMLTPGGWRMSVAMTNCGSAGWVTDRSGYRYDHIDPETGKPWPPMPPILAALAGSAAAAAGFAGFTPDACLI